MSTKAKESIANTRFGQNPVAGRVRERRKLSSEANSAD